MSTRYAGVMDCGGSKPWRALCTCGYASWRYRDYADAEAKADQHNERCH